ncbi:hypothetical protein R1flu_008918 [Riccia fluitans]|uniref:RING-type domain-containing protein n=1 Tax=Riccia fluitans TaxID=41844 RepID=A0ABD1Z0M2_9MARC
MDSHDFSLDQGEFWRQWMDVQQTVSQHIRRLLDFLGRQLAYVLQLESIVYRQAAELERRRMKLRASLRLISDFLRKERSHRETMKEVVKALEAANERNLCQICFSKARNALIMPCMHLLYCVDCLSAHLDASITCPMCKETVDKCIPCMYNHGD